MGKGDFDIDNNYFVSDDTNNNSNNLGNFSSNGGNNGFDGNMQNYNTFDSDAVFEDHQYETGLEKLKFFWSTLNKKVLLLFLIILGVIITIIIIIVSIKSSINASYKTIVKIPDLLYLNEASDVDFYSKGKENLDKTTTNFSVYKYTLDEEYDYDNLSYSYLKSKADDEDINNYDKLSATDLRNKLYEKVISKEKLKVLDSSIFTVSDSKIVGEKNSITLIPIQEGRAIIKVKSRLDKHKMADIQKKITVCPAFDSNLVFGGKISVVEGSSFSPDINFGLGNCSEGIAYTSSDEEIFSVSDEGKITGLKTGYGILTVAKGSRNFTVPVYVTSGAVAMTDVIFTPQKVQLVEDQRMRINVSYKPDNATSLSFEFESSDSSIAKVDDYGIITGVGEGSASIECSASYGTKKQVISVTVSKKNYTGNDQITDLKLDSDNITMLQGATKKINAVVLPETSSNKTLTYSSFDPDIATVGKNGVILAKEIGTTTITVKTVNNIQKLVKVQVVSRKAPVIIASDKINSGLWHTKKFTLNISGGDSGAVYYYGTDENKITTKGNKISISKDQITTYYVKACTEKKCSEPVKYIAQLDMTKPKATTVLKSSDVITVALSDNLSTIYQVCVTTSTASSDCKWNSLKNISNKPVIDFRVKSNGVYYVFGKDKAGNISDSSVISVTEIGNN